MAFHTLLAESTRRFVNSFPAKMRLFFDIPTRVDVDSISPVLPAFGLPQNNPIINSRYNVLEHIDALNSILKIFYVKGEDYCRKHDSSYDSQNLGEALENFVKKMKPKDDDVLRFFLSIFKHQDIFENGPTPSKSVSNDIKEVEDFNEEHQFWEIFKIKGKSANKLAKKLNEILTSKSSEVYGVVALEGSGKIELFHLFKGEVCKKGGEVKKISIESIDHISPLNAMGACDRCSGHGMLLEYDRLKMVKNPNLSIKQGAIATLNHSRISHHSRSFLMGLKREGIDLDKPFSKITDGEWNKIWEGSKTRNGLRDLISILEAKRYKSTIRIYLRGIQSEYPCPDCKSSALSEHAASRHIESGRKKVFMGDLVSMTLSDIYENVQSLEPSEYKDVAYPIRDLKKKLSICIDMGLGHLTGTRKVRSLSSGEYQRLLLVKYLSYQGEGSLFVLDEPSLGLGVNEQKSLFKYIKELKNQGNTILMVEHSDFFIKNSDHLITMGPGAGLNGGQVIKTEAAKRIEKIKYSKTIKDTKSSSYLEVSGLGIFETKPISFKLPKNKITWVNGDSGTGKSLYLVRSLTEYVNRSKGEGGVYDPSVVLKSTKGFDQIESIKVFDGGMSGISSRSTISTYLDLAGALRKYYANLPVSKSLNLKEGHFSANSDLGKCPTCDGKGVVEVDMTYFEDVDLVCEDCNGMKMRPYLSNISDGDHTFFEAINSPLDVAFGKINLTPKFRKLQERLTLLNLSHLNPDRKINSLSGGERLRIKLLSSLQKKVENSLLIFENISFGLSKSELVGLSEMIESLIQSENTVLVIDQNPWFKDVAGFELSFKGLGMNPKLAQIK
ncbi:MAG: hypothetical protein EP326_09875 [Deltaproteobacteria bacterium]|nr:MAG: hypothetical protein EP326_09875 [Deltaproteobacteria bacterium]